MTFLKGNAGKMQGMNHELSLWCVCQLIVFSNNSVE